ncbi:MAG: PaaI family thioesterase [Candidatus Hermodarchaeota archaeon]
MVEHYNITDKTNSDTNLPRSRSDTLPNLWAGNCFGCSPKNQYGLKLQIRLTDNGCISYAKVPDQYCGFDGIVHGGIIATLLDEISAWTLIIRTLKLGVTQKATVKYYKPVPVNTSVIVEGFLANVNEYTAKTRSYIKDLDGKVLAECSSNWLFPGFETLAKITGKSTVFIEDMFNTFIVPIKKYLNERKK